MQQRNNNKIIAVQVDPLNRSLNTNLKQSLRDLEHSSFTEHSEKNAEET